MERSLSIMILMFLLSACQFGKQEKKVEKKEKKLDKKAPKSDYTKDKGLSGFVERERSFNRELDRFSKSKEFNERNLYDLLSLIELEIKSINYMISGPRWHFRQVMNKKHDLLKKVVPAVKKIYDSCVAMAELETADFERTKDDYYLKSVRTSLKRSYAKVKVLEPKFEQMFVSEEESLDELKQSEETDETLKSDKSDEIGQLKHEMRELKKTIINQRNNGSFASQPTIIQIPVQSDRSIKETETFGRIRGKVKDLEKVANRLDDYNLTKKREIPKTAQEQKEYAKELIERLKKRNNIEATSNMPV